MCNLKCTKYYTNKRTKKYTKWCTDKHTKKYIKWYTKKYTKKSTQEAGCRCALWGQQGLLSFATRLSLVHVTSAHGMQICRICKQIIMCIICCSVVNCTSVCNVTAVSSDFDMLSH